MPKPKSTYQAESPASEDEPLNSDLDPIIDGLLHHLPAPGDTWPAAQRKLWLQILDLVLQLVYPEEEEQGGQEPEAGA